MPFSLLEHMVSDGRSHVSVTGLSATVVERIRMRRTSMWLTLRTRAHGLFTHKKTFQQLSGCIYPCQLGVPSDVKTVLNFHHLNGVHRRSIVINRRMSQRYKLFQMHTSRPVEDHQSPRCARIESLSRCLTQASSEQAAL